MKTTTTPSAVDIQVQLRLLYVERTLAVLEGLDSEAGYMADLLEDIDTHKSALAGAVVTDIAMLRAALNGPLHG